MATSFVMPKLGLTMEEGTIAEWLVADGATISPDDVVLRITTDKTETDVEAPNGGTLRIVAQVGETHACGEHIAWLLEPGEAAPAAAGPVATGAAATAAPSPIPAAPPEGSAAPTAAPVAAPSSGRLFASPNARRLAAERGLDLQTIRGTGPGGRIVSADLDGVTAAPAVAAASSAPAVQSSAPLATFAARALADLLGVDIAAIPPEARTGKVTRDAVAAHVRSLLTGPPSTAASIATPSQTAPLAPALQQPTSVVPLTGMRGIIASRMSESLDQMAQLSLFIDADVDAVVMHRQAIRDRGDAAPSYTDYVIAAVARALVDHPRANAQVTDDGIALLPDIHVGMAVALDDGLVVPVIRNATSRNLADLSAESTRLAEAARTGKLALADMEGGTFSVSTLGMFGVDGFTPIINPPNAAILGVGRFRKDVVLDDNGQVGSATRVTLSLTWDHRVFDGAPAAAFASRVVDLLADPDALDQP